MTTQKAQSKKDSVLQPICYGDYIFLKIFEKNSQTPYVVSTNGFHAKSIWAGNQENLSLKSFRNGLFQIKPNQHNPQYEFVKATETQYNLLVTLNPENTLGQKYLGSQLSLEKEKEGDRIERIDLLNTKESVETHGKPLLYGGKFTLQHVESGMYLEGSAKMSPLSEGFELKLSESPTSDMFFELKSTSSSKKKGDAADYTEQLQIYMPRLGYFMSLEGLSGDYFPRKLGTDNCYLQSSFFPAYPTRRHRPVVDNNCMKVAVSSLNEPEYIRFVNYQAGEVSVDIAAIQNKENAEEETTAVQELKFTSETAAPEYVKTGEYIRLSYTKTEGVTYYLTIYNNSSTPKIFFQTFESLEYEYNYINTVFQILKVSKDQTKLPTEEPISAINPLNRGTNNQCYYLKHVVSGRFLSVDSNGNVRLVNSDQLANEVNGSAKLQFVAKPHGENEALHRSSEFKIKCAGLGDQNKYFGEGKNIEVPTQNVVRNTTYFFGFDIPDEYLIKKLRPTWRSVSTTTVEREMLAFKYVPVEAEEMRYILEAECLANKIEDFLDFCTDLRNPQERILIDKYQRRQKEEEERKKRQNEEEAKRKQEQEELEAKKKRKAKREIHDQWMKEKLEKLKKDKLEEKRKLAGQQAGEISLDEDELEEIQIEAENSVMAREEAEGIYPEDYLEPEELAALEAEYGSSDEDYDDSYYESEEENENVSFGTEEDEALKNNIQILVDTGNAQGERKKRERQSTVIKKKPEKKKIKKREQQPEGKKEMEINTNKQVPDKKAENKETTQVETQQKPEAKKKKKRRLARNIKQAAEDFNPDKFERECLLSLSKQMQDLLGSLKNFMKDEESLLNPKKREASEEDVDVEEQENTNIHIEEPVVLSQVKQWIVREFRIIDYINVILFFFFRDDTIANKIKALQTKYLDRVPKDEDFYDFDVKTFNSFAQGLIELLLAVTKRDYLNHLYNSQFVRLYIHFLTVTNVGVYKLSPTMKQNILTTRKMILECCKEFLWDQDLDALGQLNYYGNNLISAIREEDDYEGLYIQLLDHQCRSKAPNLDNKVAAFFITDFFTKEDDLKHTFPQIEKVDGKLIVHFVRKCNKPGLNHDVPLQELITIRKGGKATENHELRPLTDYLIKTFHLVNSIANLNHLVYFQTMIKHYPLEILEEVAEMTNLSFFELSGLASDAIKHIHFNYFKLPIEKFPVQIQIVGESTIDKYMADTNEMINKNMNELISELERGVLEEKNVMKEVMNNFERYKAKRRSGFHDEESKKMSLHQNDENIYATLAKLHSFLEASIDDISLDYLRETHELFCSILEKTVEDIQSKKLKNRRVIDDEQEKNNKSKNALKSESAPISTETQSYGPDVALKILHMFSYIDNKFVNIAAIKIMEAIKKNAIKKQPIGDPNQAATVLETARVLAGTVTMQDYGASTTEIAFENNAVLTSVIATRKEIWKSRAVLYQLVAESERMVTMDNLKDEYKRYSTDKLIQTLFKMILFKKSAITREVIGELRKIANFENSLYVELKKMTMITDHQDMHRVSEIINIVSKLNYYARMYKCKQVFNKEIPQEKLKEFYKEIDEYINYLLFSIYKPNKHFRYRDSEMDPEERFLKGFNKWKTPRWDKPFRLNPEAINRTYQKIFLTLQVPKALFELINMTISITGDTYNDLDYIFVIRKAVVILCAFVYKNEENQNALYNQKYMILSYYQQSFINQTCDVMILFTELMRDNKRLQKLPIKYLYDITWYTFLGTIGRAVTSAESNSYLCTTLMGLHFLSKMTIGGFSAINALQTKFSQIANTLKADSSLDVFALYRSNKVIDLPFYYYSVREFFSSWIEICPKFIKDKKTTELLFGQFKLNDWSEILKNPAYSFQFEIRNLLCKTLEVSWYGTKHPIKVVNNFDEFKTFMFRLFADLSAYIWITSKAREELQGLKDYNFQVDPESFFGEDSYTLQLKEAIRRFKHENVTAAKVQVYIEEINIMDLWKEYIYEGCIGLLNTIVQKEAESMTTIIDYADEKFPNLISYYLYFLEKIAQIPVELKVDPFPKIDDDLVKISVLPEYKSVKEKIQQIAQVLRESRPALKMRSKSTVKTKNEAGLDMYEFELIKLLKEKKSTKEYNTLMLAKALGAIEDKAQVKEILREIINYIKKEYKKVKPSELNFVMKLLRKVIEKENGEETLRKTKIYMWESVKLKDLQKMNRIQNHYRECGLTEFAANVVTEVKNSSVLNEFLQLAIAYLYGGNREVQEEFYQQFIGDYDNSIINILRKVFMECAEGFKSSERNRIHFLYRESTRNTFEQLEIEPSDTQNEAFFEKIRENIPPEQKINCIEMKTSSMLILIFSFIQGLAEGQYTNLQNFMRDQSYTDENGEIKRLATSFDFLGEFRSLFNSFFRIHSQYSLTVGVKLIDVLTEYIQGDVPENINDLLNKTLLFDMGRVLTDFNNPYHLLPRGYDSDAYTGPFRQLKGKVIAFLKSLVEFPDDNIRERIKKYLDTAGLMDVFEANMYAFFKFNYNQPPPKKANQDWLLDQFTDLKMEDFDNGPLLDALNIYMIFRYLWEETNFKDNTREFADNVDALIDDPKRSKQRREFLKLLVHTFCPKIIHSVEVILERKLVKCWFPKLPVCRYLLKSTKEHFEAQVDRSNIQTKIADLMASSDEIIPQMRNDYEASKRFLGFNATNLYTYIRYIADMLAIAINVINLATLECIIDTSSPEYTCSSIEYEPGYAYTVEIVFVAVNIGVAALVLIMWYLTSSKRHLSTQWERYSDDLVKEKGILRPGIIEKLEEGREEELSKEECIEILRFKGMNSDEYTLLMDKEKPYLYKNIRWFLLRMNLWFISRSLTFMWHIVYLGLSIGSIFSPISATLLIADIAIQAEAIKQVFKAMITNWRQFLWTLFLLMNIALFYTFISFYALQEEFVDGDGNPLCTYSFGCFLNILNLGLRSGGGIADVIQGQTYGTDHVGHFFGRVVFDLTFFIIMITILLNLIFGMIIDAFGNLRDQKNENEEDAMNICFICGINRGEFERYMNFEDHVDREHNKWDYIFFLTYIQEKYKRNRTEMTQIENYVNERCMAKNYQWFPQTRSLTLDKKKELAQTQDDDATAIIADTVQNLSKDMTDLKKKVLGPIVTTLETLKDNLGTQKDSTATIADALKGLTNEIRDFKKKMNIPGLERTGTLA